MDFTIYVAKTKALISFVCTAKLICVFVFAYAKRWFSHDAAHIMFPFIIGSICFKLNFAFSDKKASTKCVYLDKGVRSGFGLIAILLLNSYIDKI